MGSGRCSGQCYPTGLSGHHPRPDRTFIVAVECSAEKLRRRVTNRAEPRPRGWAEQQALDINDGLRLVVTIDTTDGNTEDHARHVLAALDHASSR